jgi:hypothetical protein
LRTSRLAAEARKAAESNEILHSSFRYPEVTVARWEKGPSHSLDGRTIMIFLMLSLCMGNNCSESIPITGPFTDVKSCETFTKTVYKGFQVEHPKWKIECRDSEEPGNNWEGVVATNPRVGGDSSP